MSLFLLIFMGNMKYIAISTGDLADDLKALEIYLQDKEDYEKHCPKIRWEQPKLEVYKEKLESQLPEGCKKND